MRASGETSVWWHAGHVCSSDSSNAVLIPVCHQSHRRRFSQRKAMLGVLINYKKTYMTDGGMGLYLGAWSYEWSVVLNIPRMQQIPIQFWYFTNVTLGGSTGLFSTIRCSEKSPTSRLMNKTHLNKTLVGLSCEGFHQLSPGEECGLNAQRPVCCTAHSFVWEKGLWKN